MSKKKAEENKESSQHVLEQTVQYEKRIYDLEQLLDIAKSFCQNLDFSNLLESIVYICMAQMHVLGAEIFVRDLITNENFVLETSKDFLTEKKAMLPVSTPIASILLSQKRPLTFDELKQQCGNCEHIKLMESLNPTLIVPLIQKNHLNGMLVLQERIAIEDDASYSEYEINQIMSIASLASVAINNAALLEMSSTDMMTHLKLKYYFFNLLTEAIDAAFLNNQHIAVIMFDIDFFKKFNDTYGHECGDFVLKSVADLIRKNLRDSDIASRYGGEEFTALLIDAGKEEAMVVAERIRSTINEHDFVYNDQHLHVTISGGVSVFDAQTNLVSSPNEFVNQADQGLYMSKNNGRNRVTYFDPKAKTALKSANAKK
jgi:diguanylate cyclase (GGDEF)-like protein